MIFHQCHYRCFCRIALIAMVVPLLGTSAVAADAPEPDRTFRIGIIGLDTSHVTAFTAAFNKAAAGSELAGFKVVAAFPGGSADVESSRTRIAGFTQKLKEAGVEIVDSLADLPPKVDAVLLESVDGRPHLAQAKAVFAANKKADHKLPLFVDKPAAGSLADLLEIYRLAEESGTPCFTSSSLRYDPAVVAMRGNPKFGDVLGCGTFGPCALEEHHPDLFWYGIHAVEILFTVMGPGCESVSCTAIKDTHVVTGVWRDGRVGTFRGLRAGKEDYGAFVFGSKSNGLSENVKAGYEPLLVEIAKFFRTGQPPVSAAESLEIYAFMQAADDSKRAGGASVSIADVLRKAREENAKGK